MDALLIIAASENDANLYYASGFLAPDPFVFLQVGGKRLLLMSDLEIDRARAQARVVGPPRPVRRAQRGVRASG
jgi:Xaa-Pro aminopeptidase